MYFCVNEFEVGVNDRIFSGNEQQKVYYTSQSWQSRNHLFLHRISIFPALGFNFDFFHICRYIANILSVHLSKISPAPHPPLSNFWLRDCRALSLLSDLSAYTVGLMTLKTAKTASTAIDLLILECLMVQDFLSPYNNQQ